MEDQRGLQGVQARAATENMWMVGGYVINVDSSSASVCLCTTEPITHLQRLPMMYTVVRLGLWTAGTVSPARRASQAKQASQAGKASEATPLA